MKLIQYRFAPTTVGQALLVGTNIQTFFEREDDRSLRGVYVDKGPIDRLAVEQIGISRIAKIATKSFEQSFSPVIDFASQVSIRSNTTCRFVEFEDDGLVRICHQHEDPCLEFEGLDHTVDDVSRLLIETDLFD